MVCILVDARHAFSTAQDRNIDENITFIKDDLENNYYLLLRFCSWPTLK